jgi:hypothetical protein
MFAENKVDTRLEVAVAKRNTLDEVRQLNTHQLTWHIPRSLTNQDVWHLPLKYVPGQCPLIDAIVHIIQDGPQANDYSNPAELKKFRHVQGHWVTAFLWVIQKELHIWSRQDWPFNQPHILAQEISGTLDFLELKMCQWLHDYHPKGTFKPYRNAFDHWRELKSAHYEKCLKLVATQPPQKGEYRDSFKHIVRCLKDRQNPWNAECEPLHWNLFEAVISAAFPFRSEQTGVLPDRHISEDAIRDLRDYWDKYTAAQQSHHKLFRNEMVIDGRYQLSLKRTVVKGSTLHRYIGANKTVQIFPEKKEVKSIKWDSGRGRKSK